MTFHDYWLKGDTWVDVEGNLADAGISLLPTLVSSYDPIGVISRPTGELDPEGNQVMEDLPGWHANLRLTVPLTTTQEVILSPILIQPPANPARTWA
jgi:hypothetical protein